MFNKLICKVILSDTNIKYYIILLNLLSIENEYI